MRSTENFDSALDTADSPILLASFLSLVKDCIAETID